MEFAMKKLGIFISSAFVLLIVSYFTALWWDIKKVKNFCEEIKPGLKVTKIAMIADKHNVCSHFLCNQNSITLERLGLKEGDGRWVFFVVPPMTMGDGGACKVYHNNKVIISATYLE